MKVRVRFIGWSAVRRFFNIVLGAMAMVAVAMISAFLAMRLAIHGHEVKVPQLTHMTIAEASRKTSSMGLRLQLENRFYSPDIPAGQVLAQYPVVGATVRRQWPVRVTESLGTQQVSIPNLQGEGERAASINLRRLGLELGTVGHVAMPGSAGVVLAQSPAPGAEGVDRPRVSILLNDSTEDTTAAYVMPSLVGLTISGAYARAGAAGLRIVSAEDVTPTTPQSAPTGGASAPMMPMTPGIVVAQIPLAGHRVTRGDTVQISLTH
ncbi:PASTA domain-containing protein [Edaphobacter albus]|uniref:PASTA domain-containing protein n=1 Tax=Edaphobacter sp. 4G125 TaxID=2763071 RepID=UPI001647FA40|nr:PASTA domain-containing protein [Edaphobacter sp. 4G125]QNI38025.1 PASTA domain-containing protein [Edaphobacter sp. 4G125]